MPFCKKKPPAPDGPAPEALFANTTFPAGFALHEEDEDERVEMLEDERTQSIRESLLIIEEMYGGDAEGPTYATGRSFRYRGQFTDALPGEFQPYGPTGHQYLKLKSRAAAEERALALRRAILAAWPNTKEWAGRGWYRWMIPDGRQMSLEFEK